MKRIPLTLAALLIAGPALAQAGAKAPTPTKAPAPPPISASRAALSNPATMNSAYISVLQNEVIAAQQQLRVDAATISVLSKRLDDVSAENAALKKKGSTEKKPEAKSGGHK